eukprot:jgi/Picre1/27260/NNA_000229.t1
MGGHGTTLSPDTVLEGHEDTVEDVTFKPGSCVEVASVADDSALILWDTRQMKSTSIVRGSGQQKNIPVPDELLLQHAGHQTSVVDFCWNPDEQWTIMSASVDSSTGKGGGTLQTWKVSDLVYKSEEQLMSELEPYRDYIVSGDESQLPK